VSPLHERAKKALNSARLLLDAEDTEGACNRAYYAMFNAARAALLAGDRQVLPTEIRSHNGLMSKFNLHLVKTGFVSPEFGKKLKQVESLRLTADYRHDDLIPLRTRAGPWSRHQPL
jgi:uncharacterized protein (UPF0332 family)